MNAGERLKLIDHNHRALTEARRAISAIGQTSNAMKGGILELRPIAGHPAAIAAVEKFGNAVTHIEAMTDAMDRLIAVLLEGEP